MARTKGRSDTQGGEPPAPEGLRAARFQLDGDELAVLSYPLSSVALPECLSAAERDVALRVIAGKSNAQIAAARGTAVRTVANQIASLFKKLGVGSRREIIALGHSTQRAETKPAKGADD
jgi:DNA-binding CsgD family transcriptional regulator